MFIFRFGVSLPVLFSLLVLSTLALSCGRDDIKPPVNGRVTWTINGTTYTADAYAYAEKKYPDPNYPARAMVVGSSFAKSSLRLEIYPADAPGTFVTGSGVMNFNSVQISANNLLYRADNSVHTATATITVTELSADKIKGSFTGTLRGDDGENVAASGSFDVPLSK